MNQTTAKPSSLFERWLTDINQACGAFAAKPIRRDYHTHFQAYDHPGLHLSLLQTGGIELSRGIREVRLDAREHFYAVFQLKGQAQISQAEQRLTLTQGDVTLVDARQPCTLSFPEIAEQVSVLVPRHLLDDGQPSPEATQLPLLPAQQPLVALATGLIEQARQHAKQGFTGGSEVTDALAALLRGLLRDAGPVTETSSRGYGKALAYIDNHLDDEALSPEQVARHLGMSVRGLYRLFAQHGQVVARFIRERRLEQCARHLRENRRAIKLSALAYSYGFADSSYFTSAFKAHFGITPTAYRANHAR